MKLLNFSEFVDKLNEDKEIAEFNQMILNEAFDSKIMQTLVGNKETNIGKTFFDALSKFGIAASDIQDSDIETIGCSY